MDVQIQIEATDLWVLLSSTIRYSMGRQGYMPSYCAEIYHKYKDFLSIGQRRQIAEEIFEQIRLAEASGKFLGSEYDHNEWRNLANAK